MKKTTLSELPDLAKTFNLLKIGIDLNEISEKSSLGIAILQALKERKTKQAITMIQEVAKYNRRLIADTIGENLLIKIEMI